MERIKCQNNRVKIKLTLTKVILQARVCSQHFPHPNTAFLQLSVRKNYFCL